MSHIDDIGDMAIVSHLGSAQSIIYHVQISGKSYALKVRLRDAKESHECEILSRLNHPSLLKCYGVFAAPSMIRKLVPGAWEVVLLDYIEGYQIRYLESDPNFSARDAYNIILDLLKSFVIYTLLECYITTYI